MFSGPLDRLQDLVAEIDAATFDLQRYNEAGVFVVRKAIPTSILHTAMEDWNQFQKVLLERQVNKFNPVAVQEAPPPELEALYDNESVIAIARQIFGEDIALYSFRFVVKDKFSRDAVFLHNDVGYHSGRGVNASFFIPLSDCNVENGAMSFYPGTHMFGYLGDVGELDFEVLQPGWPRITPTLYPGDIVVMNSATWHESGPHKSGPDRVLADVILKSANDPFFKKILHGQPRVQYQVDAASRIFKRSRVSRLTEYQARLDDLPPTTHS